MEKIEPKPTSKSDNSTRFLQNMLEKYKVESNDAARGHERVYVLGSLDPRRSFYHQQRRSALLCLAVFEEAGLRRISESGRAPTVAVIGAGLAGITASSTLMGLGCAVTCFDHQSEYLSLQKNSRHRFIHPATLDWPFRSYEDSSMDLSGIRWKANFADNVVAEITRSFDQVRSRVEQEFVFEQLTTVASIGLSSNLNGQPEYLLRDSGAVALGKFDAVMLSIGYGVEPQALTSAHTPSYWGQDPFHFQDASRASPKRVLVSGSGDGGLIDTFYAATQIASYDDIFEKIPRLNEEEFIEIIKRCEQRIRSEVVGSSLTRIRDIYREEFQGDSFFDQVKTLDCGVHKVTFNYKNAGLSKKGSALNRLLVHGLLEAKVVAFQEASLRDNKVSASLAGRSNQHEYLVKWDESDTTTHTRYDCIVARHGSGEADIAGRIDLTDMTLEELGARINSVDLEGAALDELLESLSGW